MTRVDLHPEALFDRLRNGQLADEERARLEAHCAYCLACRFELRLIEDERVAADEAARDAELAAAALRRLFSAAAAAVPEASPRPQASARIAPWIAAALVLGCSIGAAAMVTHYPERLVRVISSWISPATSWEPSHARSRAADASVQQQAPKGAAGPSATSAKPSSGATASAAHVPAKAAFSKSPQLSDVDRAQVTQSDASPKQEPDTRARASRGRTDAEGALSLATQARARGQRAEAVERYRFVIERYPASRAANVAQVALGRLLYAELGQPAAALPWFDAYLTRNARGELAEEALYYRGLCLAQLQRAAEARASFQRLLEAFPNSLYTARAQARVASGVTE